MTIAKGEVVLADTVQCLRGEIPDDRTVEVNILCNIVNGQLAPGDVEHERLLKDIVDWLSVLEVLSVVLIIAASLQSNFSAIQQKRLQQQ